MFQKTFLTRHRSVITVRPERPQDEAFPVELYASTRREELDAWGWPAEMRESFLKIEFKASQGCRQAFPDAEFQIVLLNGVNAGRMIVRRRPAELHLVDIALLPQHRNAGVGAALLQRIFGEAAATRKPIRLQVFRGNRAERFYRRLGFVQTGETALHLEMEWHAPSPAWVKTGNSRQAQMIKPVVTLSRLWNKSTTLEQIFIKTLLICFRFAKMRLMFPPHKQAVPCHRARNSSATFRLHFPRWQRKYRAASPFAASPRGAVAFL